MCGNRDSRAAHEPANMLQGGFMPHRRRRAAEHGWAATLIITCMVFGYGARAPGEPPEEAPRRLQEGVSGPRLTEAGSRSKAGRPFRRKGRLRRHPVAWAA